MKISIITLFPEMFSGPFDYSIIKNAAEKNKVKINIINLREFGIGKHKTVDDSPYGGGVGMILKVDVISLALHSAREKRLKVDEERVILMSAKGHRYTQTKAKEYSNLKHLIIICGHYEGVDERIMNFIDEEVSIGDYVLTGGEIPAMTIIDSVTRLIPGVLKEDATSKESFSEEKVLEHPQYTRPEVFENLKVPSVLLSGNHLKIEEWKRLKSKKVKP